MKQVAGKLRLEMSAFRDLAAFAQFGSDLDSATRRQLDRGLRLQEVLKQGQYNPWTFPNQVTVIYAVTNDFADGVAVDDVRDWQDGLLRFMKDTYPNVGRAIEEKKALDDELRAQLDEAIAAYNQTWEATRATVGV
jgi:F-type H+-transporting ATPase subunit alpha